MDEGREREECGDGEEVFFCGMAETVVHVGFGVVGEDVAGDVVGWVFVVVVGGVDMVVEHGPLGAEGVVEADAFLKIGKAGVEGGADAGCGGHD